MINHPNRRGRLSQHVKIVGGMAEFVGKTGTIVDFEKGDRAKMYRVRLDEPVEIDGCGTVTDDLWEGSLLRRIR
jgi:hypothetical protein